MGHWERGKGVNNALPCNRHATRILEPFDKLLNVRKDPDDVRYSLPNEVYISDDGITCRIYSMIVFSISPFLAWQRRDRNESVL